MTTLCIEGGRVLRPDVTVERADMLVDREAGEILEVAPDLAGDETLDASDGLVIPGLVNVHGHAAMTLLRSNADDVPLGPWLREAVWPVEAELTAEDVRAGAELGLLEHVTNGTTAFGDMYFYMDEYVEVVEELGLRALLGYGCITVGEDDEAAREELVTSVEFAGE
jgi:5-methylthioadenosine/S-adenosylhomocysteine deaminase